MIEINCSYDFPHSNDTTRNHCSINEFKMRPSYKHNNLFNTISIQIENVIIFFCIRFQPCKEHLQNIKRNYYLESLWTTILSLHTHKKRIQTSKKSSTIHPTSKKNKKNRIFPYIFFKYKISEQSHMIQRRRETHSEMHFNF